MTPEQVNELIKNRRAIFPKTYTDEPIAKEIVDQILENANWAPTHRRTEPWRFKVFTGDALPKLGQFMADLYKELTPAEKFKETKHKKTLNKPAKCSHIIAICMRRDPEKRVPEIEEISAVACAVQNMWLTAAAYGIGAYWSSPATVYTAQMNEFLGLGEEDKCLGLFYMGNHNLPEIPGRRETPISEKVEWIAE